MSFSHLTFKSIKDLGSIELRLDPSAKMTKLHEELNSGSQNHGE